MFVPINNIGQAGAIKDSPGWELPPEAFTEARNVRFRGGWIEKVNGGEDVYNITVSATTATQNLAESPLFIMPVQDENNYYWLCAGLQYIYGVNAVSNQNNLTRYSTASASDIVYSATASIRWQGIQLGGNVILNNGVNAPQHWPTISLSTRFAALQWDSSAGTTWETRTAGAVTCEVLRSYREFGLALKTTENGTAYPRRLRWSHPVAAGVPASWDESRTGMDAGYKDFEEDADLLVDCATLYNSNIVYKENSTWAQDYVGGQFIFSFRKIFSQSGLLTANCVQSFRGKHFVVTQDDVVIHNGQTVESIIQKKWRNAFFNSLDNDYYKRTFTVVDNENEEIWIVYPETGVSSPFFPNVALVWNWKENTWAIRDYFGHAPHIVGGLVSTGEAFGSTWGTAAETYSTIARSWGDQTYQAGAPELLQVNYAGQKLVALNRTNAYRGDPFFVICERQGLAVGGIDRLGNPKVDLQSVKTVNGLWPYIETDSDTQISFYVGSQFNANDAVSWKGPFIYTTGATKEHKINCRVTGRYISWRFETQDSARIKMTGLVLDIHRQGRY